MIFRQLLDPDSSTYTYLLADAESGDAVLIDPVLDQVERDVLLLGQLGLSLRYVLDTHVHADHVTASGVLRRRLGARTVISRHAGSECADLKVGEGDEIHFGRHALQVRETPGHTAGCLTYVMADRTMAFTGDALLIRGTGRTDFQQGDARTLYRSVREKIFSLPDGTLLYPAHDYRGRTATTVGEEKRFNDRLSVGRTEDDFVAIMSRLKLARPRKIDVSLPANLRCGLLTPEVATGEPVPDRAWAVLVRNADGVPEVSAEWVRAHGEEIRIVDVREPEEIGGPLGTIPGAEVVPIERLREEAAGWSKEAPLVLVCRTGRRSGCAALDLERRGFKRVASMAGGMTTFSPGATSPAEGPHAHA